MKSYEEVYEAVKAELSEKRFSHSTYVMKRCEEFAQIHGEDVEKAKLVGIAHDIAKEVPKEDRVRIAEEHGVELDEFEKEHDTLVHGKLGAKFCEERFGFTPEMCEAIAVHTTAKAGMSKLAKILYLSDYCEESRTFDMAIATYEKGKEDLDEAFFMALVGKIKNTLDKQIPIHSNSINAYNFYVSDRK